MSITYKQGLLFILFITLISCQNAMDSQYDKGEFSYIIDGKSRSTDYKAKLYQDGFIEISNGEIQLILESKLEGKYFLNEKSYSNAVILSEISSDEYHSSFSEVVNGVIELKEYDKESGRISGAFSFVGKKRRGDDQLEIESGEFKNIILSTVPEMCFIDGKISASVEGNDFVYSGVKIYETIDDNLLLQFWHPNSSFLKLQIPISLEEGKHLITEHDSDNKTEIVFFYDDDIWSGINYDNPVGECYLTIDEINLQNKVFKGKLEGKFSNSFGPYVKQVNIDYLDLDFCWMR